MSCTFDCFPSANTHFNLGKEAEKTHLTGAGQSILQDQGRVTVL